MFKYKIGYHSYEEAPYFELEHEQKFTYDELTGMIAQAVIRIMKKSLDKNPDYPKRSFDDMLWDVVDILIEEEGFRKIEYDEIWSIFGWASFYEPERWQKEKDSKEFRQIRELVEEAGLAWSDKDGLD